MEDATNELMTWRGYVRHIGDSLYVALPPSYCKAKGITYPDIVTFSLNADGSLTLRFSKAVEAK